MDHLNYVHIRLIIDDSKQNCDIWEKRAHQNQFELVQVLSEHGKPIKDIPNIYLPWLKL